MRATSWPRRDAIGNSAELHAGSRCLDPRDGREDQFGAWSHSFSCAPAERFSAPRRRGQEWTREHHVRSIRIRCDVTTSEVRPPPHRREGAGRQRQAVGSVPDLERTEQRRNLSRLRDTDQRPRPSVERHVCAIPHAALPRHVRAALADASHERFGGARGACLTEPPPSTQSSQQLAVPPPGDHRRRNTIAVKVAGETPRMARAATPLSRAETAAEVWRGAARTALPDARFLRGRSQIERRAVRSVTITPTAAARQDRSRGPSCRRSRGRAGSWPGGIRRTGHPGRDARARST